MEIQPGDYVKLLSHQCTCEICDKLRSDYFLVRKSTKDNIEVEFTKRTFDIFPKFYTFEILNTNLENE